MLASTFTTQVIGDYDDIPTIHLHIKFTILEYRGQLFRVFSVINTDEIINETFGLFEGWLLEPVGLYLIFGLFLAWLFTRENRIFHAIINMGSVDPALDHAVRLMHGYIPRKSNLSFKESL